MSLIETVIVGGLPITRKTAQDMIRMFEADLTAYRGSDQLPRFSTSANGHVLALAEQDFAFRHILKTADHIDADGMPLVIASRFLAQEKIPERIATTDFIHDISSAMKEYDIRYYLLGSDEKTNQAAIKTIQVKYPWLTIDGHHGYFSREEEESIIERILEFKPDILWVGLGVPREHHFVARSRSKLCGVTWIKTCGGLFNFLAGQRQRAPVWVQEAGFEWLWRMVQEPLRLGPRYLSTNIKALRLMWRYRAQ
jgi:exopolysaccharide biosynthesis WecB/TagA/CpsF family protein